MCLTRYVFLCCFYFCVFHPGGGSCGFSPVTFGFDLYSICRIRTDFSNCSQLRKTAEEKLETLLKGDSLTVYRNLRPPYNSSVPLLRNGKNFTQTDPCVIPTVQDVRIQYTTVLTSNGRRAIHRVLGVRIDRNFHRVANPQDFVLTSRVSFLFVSSSKDKPVSRFWNRMFSPERSENSWLFILNAFDDVTPNEREEITFWWISLVGLISAVGVFTKFHFTFDELLP